MTAHQAGVLVTALEAVERGARTLRAQVRELQGSPELEARLLQLFFARTLYWLAFILVATLAVIVTSYASGTQEPHELFGVPGLWLNSSGWSAGIVVLCGLGIWLQARGRVEVDRAAARRRELRHGTAWVLLAVTLSAWWTFGFYALKAQLPTDTFAVGQRTFIWMTCICNVISTILLAPNWRAVAALLVGFYLPANYAFMSSRAPTSGLLLSIFGFSILVALLSHVEQRGSLLRQISLEAERRRSDELLRQLNQLVASISHDLRQPLTTIALRLESLRDHLGHSAHARSIHAVLEDQVAQMTGLINSALDLSRLQAQQYPTNPRELPLHHLLNESVRSFEDQAALSGIGLRVFAPPLIVFSDRQALGRIVCNLVSNALKYTPRGGRVLVGCQVRGDRVRISVVDNGMGIDEDDRRIIFNEYVQLGNSERDRKKGLGLGLSIVERLAALLAHPLEVDSTPGRGSRFSVLVPYKGRVPREYQQVEIGPAPVEAPPDLKGVVAVVVDDDRELGEAMAARLADWGCHVVFGASFDEIRPQLLAMLGERAPDMLFCDYRLPDRRTGVDVVGEFRAVYPGLPATIVSGNTDPATLRDVAEHGIAFLSKPVPSRVLAEHVIERRMTETLH